MSNFKQKILGICFTFCAICLFVLIDEGFCQSLFWKTIFILQRLMLLRYIQTDSCLYSQLINWNLVFCNIASLFLTICVLLIGSTTPKYPKGNIYSLSPVKERYLAENDHFCELSLFIIKASFEHVQTCNEGEVRDR
jgi:hypothetical protein